ncbi:hypothetical protein [Limnoglobus roseus]|uniref:Uncharacterized protein n=1 Tax=Limnoglobus roseus TaxID=2598579 RepID=A0A5C1AA46_9BACT|nr:hypothetical protein [Limnoglobus roseus]QEL14692.1 hypothetical protein PX52LOC_01585 [Limnoglobus roseus]
MTRDELVEMMERIPELDHSKVQFVMRSGAMLSLDILVRLEPTYLVMRGREAGNQDEGRGFFLPYADIQFLKIERVMTLAEMEAMFADRLASVKRAGRETRSDSITETPPPPSAPLDPAAIAKQNLLDRIRAAKSVITNGRPASK